MTSFAQLKQETNTLIKGAWVTLGVPFDLPMINEHAEGIVDVEALITATLLMMERDRMATDLPAWVNRFSNLINYQKLKTIFNGLARERRTLVLANLDQSHFNGAPRGFWNAFGLEKSAVRSVAEIVRSRTNKLNTIENIARASLMIRNRLLYGTGFRADLITLTRIAHIDMKGTELAKLLCANNSTISRILNDLKACRFLDHDKEMIDHFEPYPEMFMSALSVWNVCEMMDAAQFSFEELKQGALGNLNFKHDGFGRRVYSKFYKMSSA